MSFWIDRWLPYVMDSSNLIRPPVGIDLLDPYHEVEVQNVCDRFYSKYYSDDEVRTVILGINPGRLGAGVTGISFTDPEKLERCCHIENPFPKKEELSSRFIYQWIGRSSNVVDFYKQFIILSVCPLGFVSKGKNINYYDATILMKRAERLIVDQQNFIMANSKITNRVFMLGKGKNYKSFLKLNNIHGWYNEVIPLPHPRWVMQYRFPHRHEIMDEMTQEINKTAYV